MVVNINIPENWNALTDRQLKKVAKLSHQKIKPILFDYKLYLFLINLRFWKVFKYWKALKFLKQTKLQNIKEYYQWFYTANTLTRFIPQLKIKKQRLFAPANRINNITIDEFAHADDLYIGWHNTRDFEYLQYLAAILYRENTPNGKRVPFCKTELEQRAKALRKVPKSTLLAIVLSYEGSRNYLVAQFPLVFPKSKTEEKPTKTPKKAKPSNFGKIVLHLSGQKFGTYNETKNTNVYVFLGDFQEQLKSKPYA